MLTKQQALTCDSFHAGNCTRSIGPRGGVTESTETWRRNGKTMTWKTRPENFRVPVKHGLYAYSNITELEADRVHTADDCPLNDPHYITAQTS